MSHPKDYEVTVIHTEAQKAAMEQFDKLIQEAKDGSTECSRDRVNNFPGVIGEITVALAHNDHDDNIRVLKFMVLAGMVSLDEIAHAFIC